jgi:acetyl/propionyl-CoA carboxylase alpha subunit
MNTRLQVEHPITEAITGLDLVHLQLHVAAGERLTIDQKNVRAEGHAIEARVYAEDSRRLLPQSGRLIHYREPEGSGIRVDSGVVNGQTITVHYDPLLAKVIVHADSRDRAIAMMDDALARFEILGLLHNIAFLRRLLARDEMRDVRAHTRFIEETIAELTTAPPAATVRVAAAIAAFTAARAAAPVTETMGATDVESTALDPWALLGRWEL